MGKDNTKPRLEKVHGKNIVYIICIEHSRKKKIHAFKQPAAAPGASSLISVGRAE